jgi:hypothetical protein
VCLLFWTLSKAFHNGLRFRQTSVWGLSYVPNFLCVLLYGVLRVVRAYGLQAALQPFL